MTVEDRFLNLALVGEINPPSIGHTIFHFPSLASTNDLLLHLSKCGAAAHGTIVIADQQPEGRGRMGRSWQASAGSGLLMSVFLDSLSSTVGYAVGAVALRDALLELGFRDVAIKWPNDVLLNGGKVAGVLVESASHGAVIGIGTNTNMDQAELARIGQHATSLRVSSGKTVEHAVLLGSLLRALEARYQESSRDPRATFGAWRAALITIGRSVEVETAGETWSGRAVDVADDGSLLVTNGKRIVRVYSADVRLRLK